MCGKKMYPEVCGTYSKRYNSCFLFSGVLLCGGACELLYILPLLIRLLLPLLLQLPKGSG